MEPPPDSPLRAPSMIALGLVAVAGPLATDAYLAAWPSMQHTLGTSATAVQLTLTTFLLGSAAGQLTIGPISDGAGRRRLLIAASALFTLSCIGCALSPSIGVLIAARAAQGFAAGGALVVALAVVSDFYQGAQAATRFATLVSLTLLGPIVAPPLGSAVLLIGSWRLVLLLCGVLGLAMTLAAVRSVPETLSPSARRPFSPATQLARFRQVLEIGAYRRQLWSSCLLGAGNFVYISGSAFVFQTQLGVTPAVYAAAFTTIAATMTAASLAFRALVARAGPQPLQRVGVLISAGGSLGLAGTAIAAGPAPSLLLSWLLLAVILGGTGISGAATTVQLQAAGRVAPGTASALNGAALFFIGAAVSPVLGSLGGPSVLSMAVAMACCFVPRVLLLRAPGPVDPVTADPEVRPGSR